MIIVIGATVSVGLTGCATLGPPTLMITYTTPGAPAKVVMDGVARIAIKADDDRIVDFISQHIDRSGIYTVASAAEVEGWEQWWAERQSMERLKSYQAQATEISAVKLAEEYRSNAVKGDQTYSGRLLKVSGAVAEIQQDSKKRYFVRLTAGKDSIVVYFNTSETSRLGSINKGQTITVIGTCSGRNLPTMEDTAEILRLLGAGDRVNIMDAAFPVTPLKDYPGAVDAFIFVNKNTTEQMNSQNKTRQVAAGSYIDENGHTRIQYENQNYTVYQRNITVNISYRIIRTQDGSLIRESTNAQRASSGYTEQPASLSELEATILKSPEKLLAFVIDMLPTPKGEAIVGFVLSREASKDKKLKKQMNDAEELVNSGDFKGAIAAYEKIYAQYKNFAAEYNQTLLALKTESLEKAMELMEALLKKTGNTMAQNALGLMQRAADSNKAAAEQQD